MHSFLTESIKKIPLVEELQTKPMQKFKFKPETEVTNDYSDQKLLQRNYPNYSEEIDRITDNILSLTNEHLQLAANYHKNFQNVPLESFVKDMPQIFSKLHEKLMKEYMNVNSQIAVSSNNHSTIRENSIEIDPLVFKSEEDGIKTSLGENFNTNNKFFKQEENYDKVINFI